MKATVPRTFSVVSRTFSSVGWTLSPTTLLTLRSVATLRPPMTIVRMMAMRKSTVPAMVKLIIVTSRRSWRVSIPMMRYLRVGLGAVPPGAETRPIIARERGSARLKGGARQLPVVEHHRLAGRHRPLRRIEPHLRTPVTDGNRRRRRLAPVADARRRPERPLRRLAGDER